MEMGDMMRKLAHLLAACAAVPLSACATTSFAPPDVNMVNATDVVSRDDDCVSSKGGETIYHDVRGAIVLIDNFIAAYRCAARSSANGRPYFEIPAFLALAGTSAAVAFGAGPDTAIAGGVGSALFTQSGKYFAPQAKAGVFHDSLDALLCIKTEAVDIDPVTLGAISDAQAGTGAPTGQKGMLGESDPTVSVSTKEQYYAMVSAALLSVDRVTAQRLSAAGDAFDAAGAMAEFEKLAEQAKPKDTEEAAAGGAADGLLAMQVPPAPAPVGEGVLKGLDATRFEKALSANAIASAAKLNLQQAGRAQISETILHIKKLQPKLQQCVVRAKV